jgi:hypothetical protein
MEHKPDMFWSQSGAIESMAADLRLAHTYMDRASDTLDVAMARACYEKACAGCDAVDGLLKRNLPDSGAARDEFGAALLKLRARLRAYERDMF